MLRFILCCVFSREPIRFRYTTAKALVRLGRMDQLAKPSELCLANAKSLLSEVKEFGKRRELGLAR